MAPLAKDPIMSGRSIPSFRHFKHQNLSTCDDFIHSSGILFLVPFLATREVVALLANDPIMSGRSLRLFKHLECKNMCIILSFHRLRRMWPEIRNGTPVDQKGTWVEQAEHGKNRKVEHTAIS